MQNFYELENLMEKKKLDEVERRLGVDYTDADYAGKRPSDVNVATDQFGSRQDIPDPGKALDREVRDRNWAQAKINNPNLQSIEDAQKALRADSQADAAAQAGVGIQSLAGRKGGRGGDVIRTSQNDMRTALGELGTPESQNALILQDTLFQKQYFGKTFDLPDLLKIIVGQTRMGIDEIKPALNLLRKAAGDQMRVFKTKPYPKIQIVDPFPMGGTGSAPEAPDVDAEDITTAAGGAAISDQPTADPMKRSIAGGPQKLAPQEGNKWQEVEGRANQVIMKYSNGIELPDPEEIESIVNDLKGVASEYPEKKLEIKGFIGELEGLIPQREWLDIFESMCLNGI